jgi:hypothetical protein
VSQAEHRRRLNPIDVLADRGFVQSGFNDVPHLGVQTFVPRWDLVEPSEIQDSLKRAHVAGLTWPLPGDLTDTVLETRLFAHCQGGGGFQIFRLDADEVEDDGGQARCLDVLRQAGHFGGECAQGGVAAAKVDNRGLLFDDAVLDQILERGDDAGWRFRVRARHICEVAGEGGVAGVYIGQDRTAAVEDRHFGDPSQQGGFAGLAEAGREDDLCLAG